MGKKQTTKYCLYCRSIGGLYALGIFPSRQQAYDRLHLNLENDSGSNYVYLESWPAYFVMEIE